MADNFDNNQGQFSIAKDNSTINATQNIYRKLRLFNEHKKIMQIPPLLSNNFTGREEYILEIESLLTKQEVVVLSGTGGIGKTQIALKYIKS